MALNFLKTQFSQTTNSSTSEHEFLHSLHDNLWKLFYRKSQHIFMRTYNERYVHGLFTTEVEVNWTSDCTQLYFVESISKNFVLTDGTGSYCGGLHSLFTSHGGLISVFWSLLWSRNAAVTTWLLCEVVACNFICAYSDRWKYVSQWWRKVSLPQPHIGVNICRFVKSGGLR